MGRKRKVIAPKPCSVCGGAHQKLVRIKTDPDAPWQMVCEACWPSLAEGNDTYQYGGLWRAHKRRRS